MEFVHWIPKRRRVAALHGGKLAKPKVARWQFSAGVRSWKDMRCGEFSAACGAKKMESLALMTDGREVRPTIGREERVG